MSVLKNAVLLIASICVSLVALEIGARAYFGKTSDSAQATIPQMRYHEILGWEPNPGFRSLTVSHTDEPPAFRNNGTHGNESMPPILAVGDSFTYGDEVADDETWPAQLQSISGHPVLNAGVGAYGIDQAVLRAEIVLDRFAPTTIIVAFISDDINRTEFHFYPWGGGHKPFFTHSNGELQLNNTPVPRRESKYNPAISFLRGILKKSVIADKLLYRYAFNWWKEIPKNTRAHDQGERVSAELITRLDERADSIGARFLAVALPTNGKIGDNSRIAALLELLRDDGVDVLDLVELSKELDEATLKDGFERRGHYSPDLNSWVAQEIAAHLGY